MADEAATPPEEATETPEAQAEEAPKPKTDAERFEESAPAGCDLVNHARNEILALEPRLGKANYRQEEAGNRDRIKCAEAFLKSKKVKTPAQEREEAKKAAEAKAAEEAKAEEK